MNVSSLNPRKVIAKRLKKEFERRYHSIERAIEQVAIDSKLSKDVIEGYLSTTRNLSLSEIYSICESINCNYYLFISGNYSPTQLCFRNTNEKARKFAAKIENTFQIIETLLPNAVVSENLIDAPSSNIGDIQELLAVILKNISQIKSKYGEDVENILNQLGLTIIPVESNIEFDAFTLFSNPKYAICVNLARPPSRIMFSLAHELAHFFFDRNKEIEVDIFKENFLFESINKEKGIEQILNNPEYIASKFAQFLLIPFDVAEKWVRLWRREDYNSLLQDVQSVIFNRRISKEVAIIVLWDVLRIHGKNVNYQDLKIFISRLESSQDRSILDFLNEKKILLKTILDKNKNSFSEDVFTQIGADFELDK